ncbi:unnamed protein product, partial [Allacma fusca]
MAFADGKCTIRTLVIGSTMFPARASVQLRSSASEW